MPIKKSVNINTTEDAFKCPLCGGFKIRNARYCQACLVSNDNDKRNASEIKKKNTIPSFDNTEEEYIEEVG